MKVFISWSGARSKHVATALRDWLPQVIQSVKPWMSDIDIEAGKRWSGEIADQLDATGFGIVCVTPENMGAQWVNFESGALAKKLEESSSLVPYLCAGLKLGQLTGPLSQFQAKVTDKADTLDMLQAIDKAAKSGVDVHRQIDKWWGELEKRLNEMPPAPDHLPPPPNTDEVLERIVGMLRGMGTTLDSMSSRDQGAAFRAFIALAQRRPLNVPVTGRDIVDALTVALDPPRITDSLISGFTASATGSVGTVGGLGAALEAQKKGEGEI